MANQALQDLIASAYGPTGEKAQNYLGVLNKGYESLDQPLNDPNTGREGRTSEFITNLASTFADSFYKKTGKLPSQDQVQNYVSQIATPQNASKFITGNLNSDQMNLLGSTFLQNNPDILQGPVDPNAANPVVSQTQNELNDIYGPLQEEAVGQVNRQFAPLRSRAIEEEAALGRLRSGVSAAPGSAISQVDSNQSNALGSIIGNILGQKASGTLDLTKYNQGLDLSKQQLAQAQNQFNQNLAFNQDKYQNDLALQNKGLKLSEILGKMQAQQKQPGTLDYINTGIGGLSAIGNLVGGFGLAKSALGTAASLATKKKSTGTQDPYQFGGGLLDA